MCNSRCTETRCLALQSKHRDRHRKSVVRKHRDENIVFKKTWNIALPKTRRRWDICWFRLMKRKDAHFDAKILHISMESGSNIGAASVKVGFTSILHVMSTQKVHNIRHLSLYRSYHHRYKCLFTPAGLNWAKLRLKNQKAHLDKTPTFKMVQKPTLTKHPPL